MRKIAFTVQFQTKTFRLQIFFYLKIENPKPYWTGLYLGMLPEQPKFHYLDMNVKIERIIERWHCPLPVIPIISDDHVDRTWRGILFHLSSFQRSGLSSSSLVSEDNSKRADLEIGHFALITGIFNFKVHFIWEKSPWIILKM